MIDLRSDTVTRPTSAMLEAMMLAPVGDDVFGEDPTVNELEAKLAELFGKEKGLFCSSGTLANQIAIKTHTDPGDQVICSWAAHVYNYEGGGMAMNSGVTAKLLDGERGMFTHEAVKGAILPLDPHYPISKLVVVEDTSNKGGGAIWDYAALCSIRTLCTEQGLKLHLDGARVFNRIVAEGTNTEDYGPLFDSLSICLSKGLGAPVGSVLIGSKEFIAKARRIRKAFGGGMRQAGFLAGAGIYALDHHIDRLKIDHQHAKIVAKSLNENEEVASILSVETNIIVFYLRDSNRTDEVLKILESKGILAFATGPESIRFVFHLDISREETEIVAKACRTF